MAHGPTENTLYDVVVNDEEQFSIWPTTTSIPAGWRPVGVRDDKERCLEHIARVWTDMRPLSLRERMDRTGAEGRPTG